MPVCLGAVQDVCLLHSGLTIISWWELMLKQSLLRAPNLSEEQLEPKRSCGFMVKLPGPGAGYPSGKVCTCLDMHKPLHPKRKNPQLLKELLGIYTGVNKMRI